MFLDSIFQIQEQKNIQEQRNKYRNRYVFYHRMIAGRAGAAGCLKYPTGCLKKKLGAEHQKNRSRENAFAEVLFGI